MQQKQLPAPQQLQSPQPRDDWRHSLAASHWRHRYLIARSACDSDDEAIRRARVSIPIVMREVDNNPEFAELRQRAIDRTLVLGNDDSTRLARENFPHILEHAITRATEAPKDRDQAVWARLTGEAAGVVGRPLPDQTARETAQAIVAELRAMREAAMTRWGDDEDPALPAPQAPEAT